ncbi:MAG: VOC family protein [Chloroflexi bacterium]|nr:VOC family protein [Chloroflexota bacterium]
MGERVVTIRGIHHLTAIARNAQTTVDFYTQTLGLRLVKRTVNFDNPKAPHLYFGVGGGAPGTIITYFAYPRGIFPRGVLGAGMTHHFAFEVGSDDAQLEWRDRLQSAGVLVSPVQDRQYFRSIYFRDPDGHILEIATTGPGFQVDEPAESLGTALKLPTWLERDRADIEGLLTPLRLATVG